jgi:NitT/TauT family transport system permease protein/sulfonate transport system permease protein
VNSSVGRNISGFVVFFGLWQMLASLGWINPVLLPSPLQLVAAAYDLMADGILWKHTLASLNRVLTGFLLAAVTGIAFGVALGWSEVLSDFVRPLVESVRPIPPIAWTPIAILWFGVGDAPSYFLVFIGAVFPVFVSTFSAVRNIDRVQINAALCLGAKPGLLIRDVLIPASLPVIFPGLRIALGVGWMCVVAAELIAAQSGLGYMIQQNRVLLQTQNVVTGMITIGVVGFTMSALMEIAEKRLLPWTERPK